MSNNLKYKFHDRLEEIKEHGNISQVARILVLIHVLVKIGTNTMAFKATKLFYYQRPQYRRNGSTDFAKSRILQEEGKTIEALF